MTLAQGAEATVMSRVVSSLLAGLAIMSLVACAVPPRHDAIVASVAVLTSSDGAVLGAQVSGTLALTPDNCFGIGDDDEVAVVVFPVGTQIQADASGVTVPGIGDLELGDQVVGVGGGVDVTTLDDADIPPQCQADVVTVVSFD